MVNCNRQIVFSHFPSQDMKKEHVFTKIYFELYYQVSNYQASHPNLVNMLFVECIYYNKYVELPFTEDWLPYGQSHTIYTHWLSAAEMVVLLDCAQQSNVGCLS